MDYFAIFYTVLGGLGLFFYGMKALSDSLQAVAGDVIRKIINSLTSNRVLAVLIGTAVTCVVQSSSITTVMVVGLVNAGLMSLTQAIGVIFGANIGTTITGWMISIKIGKYALLFIGTGILPALFAKNEKWRNIGRTLFGIGMVFMGLETMSDAFKPLRTHEGFISTLSYFSGQHHGAYIACILMGCILTMIIQSSSAMLGITIALASTGVINFSTAAALVLGENIGTTITALLASVGTNTNARRAAYSHALFNVIGVMIVLSIFPFYRDMVDSMIPGDPNMFNEKGDRPHVAVHIATIHSVFNIANVILFLPFLNYLAKLVTFLAPEPKIKEQHHLKVLGDPQQILPATALIQAENENKKMFEIIQRMFELVKEMTKSNSANKATINKIQDYENITDNIQKEVTVFVCALMEKELSREQSLRSNAAIQVADELESVADYIVKWTFHYARLVETNAFTGAAKEEVLSLLTDVEKFLTEIGGKVSDPESLDFSVIGRLAEQLRLRAEDMRQDHLKRIASGEFSALTALDFSDMVVSLRKIRTHSLAVANALERVVKA